MWAFPRGFRRLTRIQFPRNPAAAKITHFLLRGKVSKSKTVGYGFDPDATSSLVCLVRRSETLQLFEPIEHEMDLGRGDGVRGIFLYHQKALPVG